MGYQVDSLVSGGGGGGGGGMELRSREFAFFNGGAPIASLATVVEEGPSAAYTGGAVTIMAMMHIDSTFAAPGTFFISAVGTMDGVGITGEIPCEARVDLGVMTYRDTLTYVATFPAGTVPAGNHTIGIELTNVGSESITASMNLSVFEQT